MMRIASLPFAMMIATLALSGAPALAAALDEAAGEIIQLTPEQKREALDSGSAAASRSATDLSGQRGGGAGQIHGEVGAMIGTGGARGVYGTAAVPLGENAGAIISFEKSRYGRGQGWIPVCTNPRCRIGVLPE